MLGSAPLQSDVRLALLSRERVMDVGKVGVVGAGTMGNGIAHVFARSGLQVILSDIEPRFLDRAIQTIEKNLEREVAKDRKSTRLNSSHANSSYAVFCLKKKT